MSDTPTLARFFTGWAEDGLSKDGLPHYRQTVKIRLSRPPYLQLEREATEADFEDYSGPYALFLKEQKSRTKTPAEGYPLALWPVVSASELQMLSARDVYTVEQLAKLSGRGAASEGIPGELRQLAERAKKMIDLQKDIGKFEAIIRDKDGQIEALNEQVKELRGTIQAQDGIINSLKTRVA